MKNRFIKAEPKDVEHSSFAGYLQASYKDLVECFGEPNDRTKAGQIYYVENGKEVTKENVLEKWQKTVFLKKIKKADAKGWILDIMNCIDALNKTEFTLADIYSFENDLKLIHPENRNIKPKIRQQLQFLRDKGYLEFAGDGVYRLK